MACACCTKSNKSSSGFVTISISVYKPISNRKIVLKLKYAIDIVFFFRYIRVVCLTVMLMVLSNVKQQVVAYARGRFICFMITTTAAIITYPYAFTVKIVVH